MIEKGKLIPCDIGLEENVLGAMMIDEMAVETAIEILSPKVFYKREHELIYTAIQDLHRDSFGVDLSTVSNRLKKNGVHADIGGDLFLIQLQQKTASSAHVEYHSRLLLQEWVRRELIKLGSKQVSNAYNKTVDLFDLIDGVERDFDKVGNMLERGSSSLSFSDALLKVVDRVEMLSNQQEHEFCGVHTGFRTLNEYTGGWQNGDLIIVAARPGMGKTAFILKNISEIINSGDSVGMFSLEMSSIQLATRMVAINSDFHLNQLFKNGFEKDEYFNTLNEVVGSLSEAEFLIDDRANLSVYDLYMKARMWKRKFDIKAVFVDYIQLMGGDNNTKGNREQEVSLISRKLKQLAKELDIPVIALSQLSRSVETRGGDRRPRLSDLRESGAIEQDADIVIFIYRPEYYGLEPEQWLQDLGGDSEICFAKFRAGSIGTRVLRWIGDKTKFVDVDEYELNTPY